MHFSAAFVPRLEKISAAAAALTEPPSAFVTSPAAVSHSSSPLGFCFFRARPQRELRFVISYLKAVGLIASLPGCRVPSATQRDVGGCARVAKNLKRGGKK